MTPSAKMIESKEKEKKKKKRRRKGHSILHLRMTPSHNVVGRAR
jgi:hypothetical protein